MNTARSRAATALLGALLGASCTRTDATQPDHTVLLVVRSTYPRTGEGVGVNQFRLRTYRRRGAEWVVVDSATVFFHGPGAPGSGVTPVGGRLPMDGGVAVLPEGDDEARILLRADPSASDPTLIEVQPGGWTPDASFVPVGPPSLAQFDFPPMPERLVITLEQICRDEWLRETYGSAAPWYDCTSRPDPAGGAQQCPWWGSICVHWNPDGTAVREACRESLPETYPAPASSATPDGGCLPGATSAGSDGDASCVETCGLDGRWSHCDRPPSCGVSDAGAGAVGQPCCEVPVTGATCVMRPMRRCASGGVCFEDSCVQCGMSGQRCCPDGVCTDGTTCSDAGFCGCGGMGAACCTTGTACDPGLGCTGASGGTCVPCGREGQPCCAGGCLLGLACAGTPERCTTCPYAVADTPDPSASLDASMAGDPRTYQIAWTTPLGASPTICVSRDCLPPRSFAGATESPKLTNDPASGVGWINPGSTYYFMMVYGTPQPDASTCPSPDGSGRIAVATVARH